MIGTRWNTAVEAPSTWDLIWELPQLPLVVLGAYGIKRLSDRVYASPMRHTALGFALMYLSWLVYGALLIVIYIVM